MIQWMFMSERQYYRHAGLLARTLTVACKKPNNNRTFTPRHRTFTLNICYGALTTRANANLKIRSVALTTRTNVNLKIRSVRFDEKIAFCDAPDHSHTFRSAPIVKYTQDGPLPEAR